MFMSRFRFEIEHVSGLRLAIFNTRISSEMILTRRTRDGITTWRCRNVQKSIAIRQGDARCHFGGILGFSPNFSESVSIFLLSKDINQPFSTSPLKAEAPSYGSRRPALPSTMTQFSSPPVLRGIRGVLRISQIIMLLWFFGGSLNINNEGRRPDFGIIFSLCGAGVKYTSKLTANEGSWGSTCMNP
eukprot:1393192-Amorphochlora_amoeboformis.AAC.1